MITLFNQNGFERQLDRHAVHPWEDYKRLLRVVTGKGTVFDMIQLVTIREDGEEKQILCNEDGEMLGQGVDLTEPLLRNGLAYKRFQYLGFPRWWGNVILLTGNDLLKDEEDDDNGEA